MSEYLLKNLESKYPRAPQIKEFGVYFFRRIHEIKIVCPGL